MVRAILLGSGAAMLAAPAAAAAAQEHARQVEASQVLIPPSAGDDVNPTQRAITLTVPLRESGRYRGDVVITIAPDDAISVSASRLVDLLAEVLDRKTLDRLRAAVALDVAELRAAGVVVRYNAQDLALDVEVALERRASRDVQVSALDAGQVGEVVTPARVSGFLNARSNVDFLHGDGGLAAPLIYLDAAVRVAGVVAESDALWQPGGDGPSFTRAGSRLVHDDRERLVRWTAGDLQPIGRGFQSLPEMAGISLFRSFGVLEPQRIARPRGGRAFVLTRPSTVEVSVNGQLARRVQLDPGNYDLRDFPFTQGANDVRLSIRDDAGRTQMLNFNIFLDQNQLGRGLTEFGAYVGVLAAPGLRGPKYSDQFAASGFVRRGLGDQLTVGLNAQGGAGAQLGGVEGIWSSPVGTFAGTASLSNVRNHGFGSALLMSFQRTSSGTDSTASSVNLFVERRSRNFGALGTLDPSNPFAWEAGGGYSRAIGNAIFAGIDGRYSRGRGEQPSIYNARGTIGWRLSDALNLATELRWERDNFDRRLSGLLTATMRLGRSSNLRADYDTRFDRARLSYSTFRGYGVGAYNLAADIDRSAAGSGANVTANYVANRAELGFSHFGSFDNLFGQSLTQRSSLRIGSSLSFADGSVAVGRPITDSFAIVRGHRSLEGARVEVESTAFGRIAETSRIGAAVHPALASYIGRTLAIDVPDAPVTAELGLGSFRLLPPYRSGYRLTVGSANNVTALGRMLDAQGQPVSLTSGTAVDLAERGREPVALFTNRDGRFGVTGLAPGRWEIRMNDDAGSVFLLLIATDAAGMVTVGDLRPGRDAAMESN